MSVISTIYASQESVNDDYISLLAVYVKTGDQVVRDSLLAEFETSKAVMEVRAEADGYVAVLVQPNTDIKVGSKMFELSDSPVVATGITAGGNNGSNESVTVNADPPLQQTKFSKAAADYLEKKGMNAAAFKHLAFVTTKDLQDTEKDKVHAAKSHHQNSNGSIPAIVKETNPAGKTIKPLAANKRREYEFLYSVNSSSVISRLSTFIKVDNKENIGLSQNFIKSTPLPTVIHEISRLLLKFPNLNSFYINGEQAFYNVINVGFALDDGKTGLKVASIFDTDKQSLYQVEESISQLSLKYTAQELKVDELTSCTFTITDLYNTGVLSFHPLINSNNSSILGISGYNNGGFVLDLSFDHRLTSGKEVSLFLEDLKFRLEHRFATNAHSNNHALEDIQCFNCYRHMNDDLDGNIYFTKIKNTKHDGYICSNCLKGW
jgi:pyruvate/2-oxoglutarate dehydrogenase complex dihydrolipoamide acyltransferase (E2) component